MDGDVVRLDARVRMTSQRNAGVSWSIPLDRRLDDLVEAATDAGDNTTRKELVAAILADFEADPAELRRVLTTYRTMTVGELLRISPNEMDNVVSITPHGPGPRSRGRA